MGPPPACAEFVQHAHVAEVTLGEHGEVAVTQRVTVRNPAPFPLAELVFQRPLLAQHADHLDVAAVRGLARPSLPSHVDARALVVQLDAPLPVGAEVTLEVRYRATLPETRVSGPTDLIRANGFVVLGDVLATVPPWEGAFQVREGAAHGDDHYFEPADFRVTVDVPEAWDVVATGVAGEPRVLDGRARSTFVAEGVRTFALAACAGCVHQRAVAGDVVVRSMQVPTREVRADGRPVAVPLDDAVAFLGWAVARFGPLSAREIDIVALPFEGDWGIEYPGLVTTTNGDSEPFVVAHELAHQWWFGEVGNDAVRYPVVDEGLADWSVVAWMEDVGRVPAFVPDLRVLMDNLAQNPAAGLALRKTVHDYGQPGDYYLQVYWGGLRMWEEVRALDPAAFDVGLKRYLADLRCKNAGPTDLIDRVAAASDRPDALRAAFERWMGR